MKFAFTLILGTMLSLASQGACLVEDHCPHPVPTETAPVPPQHAHVAKHQMIVFGSQEALFVSHLVYRAPHNFQVILKISPDVVTRDLISQELKSFPNDQLIYLLDSMEIGLIQQKPVLNGKVFRRLSDQSERVLIENFKVSPEDYTIVYFDELPLILGASF